MVQIEEIAQAILDGNGLLVRSLVQDFLRAKPCLQDIPKPAIEDHTLLAIAAALLELFAQRLEQSPPEWTADVGPVSEPVFLVRSSAHMKHLRRLCETEAPLPLRKRRLYAPANYLEFV